VANPIDGVKDIMAENTRYQTAQACAGEVLEALYTVYWGDSFDAALLESRLTETIHFFTRNARSLEEPHPHPEQLEQGALEAIASVGQCYRVGGHHDL
jgi:hypothetical protein